MRAGGVQNALVQNHSHSLHSRHERTTPPIRPLIEASLLSPHKGPLQEQDHQSAAIRNAAISDNVLSSKVSGQ